MNLFLVAQFLGFLGLISWLYSVLQKDHFKILKFQNLANMFYMIQYTLLGAYPASCMNLISMLRGIVFFNDEKNNRKTSLNILILFFIVIVLAGLLAFQNIYSLIPIIITLLYSYSLWQKNLTIFRVIFVLAASGWFVYNLLVGAYVTLIGNIFEFTFGIVSIIKYDFMKK